MPVLRSIRERFAERAAARGAKVAACLHVTAETANLMQALAAGGAEPALCSANPLTTQDEVAAALVEDGVPVLAARGEDVEAYVQHVHALAAWAPDITLDDGADLLVLLHEQGKADAVRGGAEETTTGLLRLRRLEAEGRLACPGDRRQRVAHRAHLQRPLRHRPVGARRHPARDQPAAGGPHARAVRLRRRPAAGSRSAPAAPAPP